MKEAVVKSIEAQIVDSVAECYGDPLKFALLVFDWGQGELADYDGPNPWQREVLTAIGEQVRRNKFNGKDPVQPIQIAVSSGHGIGKSALTAMLILWIMATRPNCRGMVTANTSDQLRTKTWGELAKWLKLAPMIGHWFKYNNGRANMTLVKTDHEQGWRCDALTSREENSEAFAGLHAATSTPFYIFDEASAIPEKIWEVAQGGLTDGEPIMIMFGNPTRNNGSFFECFHRMKHRWQTFTVDSRKVPLTNKALIQQWVDDYGEDSDFVRVRVRGLFPRAGGCQFIPSDVIAACRKYKADITAEEPVTIAVDVARFGDDQTVISRKKGRKLYPMKAYRNLDTMQTADLVIEAIREYNPAATFIDGGGVGGGVVDRCKQLNFNVVDVNFGSKPSAREEKKYANKRAEMFGKLRDALKAGMEIPDDNELADDMAAIEYGFNAKQQILLESKESMKKRGRASPDKADAAALHFAEPVHKAKEEYFGSEGWQ